MLSMINPDTLSRYEAQNRFATSGGHMSQKGSQENFFPNGHHEEVDEHMNTMGNE
jgi:hypothetical protein